MALLAFRQKVERSITVPVDADTAYDLCHQALHETLGCRALDRDPQARTIRVSCQHGTIAGGYRYDVSFTLTPQGDTTRIDIGSAGSDPGWLSAKFKRERAAAVDALADYLTRTTAQKPPA